MKNVKYFTILLFLLSSIQPVSAQNCLVTLSPLNQNICKGDTVSILSSVTTFFNPCQLSDIPVNLQSGLVAWYPFCGNANDMSGNGNHGTVIGATLAPDRFGNANMAYYFDGISNSIVIPNSPSLNVDSLSIVAFIRPDAGLGQAIILVKSDSLNATNYSYHFNYEAVWAGNQGLCSVWGDGNCSPPSSVNASVVFAPSGLFNSNFWNMTAMTVDATGYSEIYLDTSIVGSGATGIPLISCNSSSSTVRIGGVWWPGHPQRFKGYIDDVFVFNRPLSQVEIKQLFHLYSANNTPLTYLWSTGATTPGISVSPGATSTYSVTVSTPNNSCFAQGVVNIIPVPLPISGPINTSGNQQAQYSAPFFSGYNYFWSVQNGMILSGQGTSSIQVQWNNITGSGIVKLIFCNDSSQYIVRLDSINYGDHCFKMTLPANLQNGLNAYYPFCGDATDHSGNGNHGIPYGLALVPDRFGNASSAYYFNGMGDHIVVPNSNTLNIDSGTFVAFLTPDPGTSHGYILAKSDSMDATDYSYHLVHDVSWQGNYGFFGAWGDGNCNVPSSINANYVFSPNLLSSTNWQMVVVTVDALGNAKLYRNGILITSVSTGVPMESCNNLNSTLRIGGPWWVGYPDWFQGIIDDILIYNRVLDSTEINQLYSLPLSRGNDIPQPDQVDVSSYPNPSDGDFRLSGDALSFPAQVSVFSLDGRLMGSLELNAREEVIPVQLMPSPGLYFLDIQGADRQQPLRIRHIRF